MYEPWSVLIWPALAAAQTWPADLQGTWSSKSKKTLTGPSFYDPVQDLLIEPDKTGISYSFTLDGHYESAHYRAIANPVNPACPGGIMQWQHGSWVLQPNSSLTLTPIAIDGRQLLSKPCDGDNSVYIRYNQSELFERYSVYTDPYHQIPRLDLFKFDGAPEQPLYQISTTPEMLPTTTLNTPSTSSTEAARRSKRTAPALEKRGAMESLRTHGLVVHRINADRLWWIGLAMTGIGGLLYLGPRRMGLL